jgi:hypothetical protein
VCRCTTWPRMGSSRPAFSASWVVDRCGSQRRREDVAGPYHRRRLRRHASSNVLNAGLHVASHLLLAVGRSGQSQVQLFYAAGRLPIFSSGTGSISNYRRRHRRAKVRSALDNSCRMHVLQPCAKQSSGTQVKAPVDPDVDASHRIRCLPPSHSWLILTDFGSTRTECHPTKPARLPRHRRR